MGTLGLRGVGESHEQQPTDEVARSCQGDVGAQVRVLHGAAKPYAEEQVQRGDDDVIERPKCEEEPDEVREGDAAADRVDGMQQVGEEGQQGAAAIPRVKVARPGFAAISSATFASAS